LQNQIANILNGPFEEFLAVGRRIQNKLDPEVNEEPEPGEGVEKLMARLTHYVMDHQRIEKELVDTKKFYEEIVQNLQSGVLVTDKDDKIFFANQSMFNIAGIPPEKLLGINIINGKDVFPEADLTEFAEKHMQAKKISLHFIMRILKLLLQVVVRHTNLAGSSQRSITVNTMA
jgi:PAS domain-containing protein